MLTSAQPPASTTTAPASAWRLNLQRIDSFIVPPSWPAWPLRIGARLPSARIDEHLEQIRIEVSGPAFFVDQVERAFHRHRLLVRPVARGERVEDVADRQDPGLHADLPAAQAHR